MLKFNDHLIPVKKGQAVTPGWKYDNKPYGVTWHWTATWNLKVCRRILGGANAMRKGKASAHFGVGRSKDEGIDRYVRLDNRSWHAGANQSLRWDGKPTKYDGRWCSGARTTVGIEMVNIGYARKKIPKQDDHLYTYCRYRDGQHWIC